jgi:ubiquinone/menaquinone biosynthesis C-methylase UbiE
VSDLDNQALELRKLWSGFQSARILLTANNFRVFGYLRKRMTAKQLASRMRTDTRATEILLDALTGIKLLKKEKTEYINTQIASRFLVAGKRLYQGDIINHADTLWQNWSGLDSVVKTGMPFHASQNHSAFILGMHNLAVFKAKEIIQGIALKGVKRALDLGGGPGTYTLELAKKKIDTTLFDTPDTIKIAKRIVRKERVKHVHFLEGDFFSNDIGTDYDLIFMSHILHSYSEKKNIALFKKCWRSVNKGGKIVIRDFYIHENRTRPAQSAIFAINMLVNTEGGRCYSPREVKKWLLDTGFKEPRKKCIDDCIIISARK